MGPLSAHEFKDILLGIFFLSMYFQGLIRFYFLVSACYFYFALSDIAGFGSEPLYGLFLPVFALIGLTIWEVKRLKKEGQDLSDVTPLLPSRANKIFGAILLATYLLSRMFYFDQ